MYQNCLLLLLCLSTTLLYSQQNNPYQTLVYQITTDEYIALEKGTTLNESYLHTLVDSTFKKELPALGLGYYIKAYPQQEQLQLEVIANTSISLISRSNKRDLMLEVIDSMGIPISNASVFLKNKAIPFDKKTNSYRLKKWKEKVAPIMVKANGEVIFYHIKKNRYRYDGYSKTFAYRIKAPARLAKRIWWRLKDGFAYGEWFPNRSRTYKGYLALSQPKYRPNDTLKIKGYFTNKRGKPLNRPLEFQLNNNGKNRLTKIVSPVEKGVYILNIPLHDSLNLTLDKTGNIYVYDNRKWEDHQVKSHRFQYEDYQLDEVTYSLTSNKKVYEYGEKVSLKAAGRFKTGQFIPDGTLRLTLRTKYTPQKNIPNHRFFDKQVIVKNLLWETVIPLSANKPTQILVPDSIFSKVELPVYAQAEFTNSNGEVQYKNLSFAIKAPVQPQPLSLTLAGAYIIGTSSDTSTKKSMVEWFVYDEDESLEGTKLVQLPHKERVNGQLYGYDISFPNSPDFISLMLEDSLDLVGINGKHHGNKVNIKLENPRQLSITYQLYKGKKLVETSVSDQAIIAINRNAVANKNYVLKYQYVWAGRLMQKEERFIYLKKALNIAIEQPKTVIPGQQIPIKIIVRNQKNHLVKGVNLTAGSINGQFNNNSHFTKLEVPYKLSKSPKIFHDIAISPEISFPKGSLPITKSWATKTRVDSQLFYQLRFPESGVFMQYDAVQKTDFHQNIAQFAPYLIKDGRAQPIYMIYCNRKLVYYYDVDDNPPYVFVGQEGYNSIQLRTKNYTYQVDSVLLKKGQKLEFSIDVNQLDGTGANRVQLSNEVTNPLSIKQTKASLLMTPLEKQLIENTMFVFQPKSGKHHLFQDSTNIHIFSPQKYSPQKTFKLGPFYPNQSLNYVLKDSFETSFLFEPNFNYQLSKNRERLYEYNFLEGKISFPKKLPLQQPHAIVYAPKDITRKTNTPKKIGRTIIYHDVNKKSLTTNGQLQFQLDGQSPKLIVILWKSKEAAAYTLKPTTRKIQDESGSYQLILVKKDSSFAEVNIELVEKELLFLNLNQITFQKDSLGEIFQQISFKSKKEIQKGLSQKPPHNPTTTPSKTSLSAYDYFPITLNGTVTDETGEALIGASVLIKGTTIGTVTDVDGNYTLNVPNSDYKLVISYTGYATQEVQATANSSNIQVTLSEGLELLEVVVTGLNIRKEKKALGYARATITSDKLAGKVAGVQIQEIKKQKRLSLLQNILPANNQLRSNFQDHAFWQPNLVTDRNGEAHFTTVFPDNLTQWQTFVIGMDKKQRVGVSFANTNAFKPLVAQLAIPRFMVEGDKAKVIGKAINFTDDSFKIHTSFKVNNEIVAKKSATIQDAIIEKYEVKAASEKDTISLSYQLNNGAYGDGEQRKIPIFSQGILENKGSFYLLDTDTTLVLDFPDKNLPITVRIEGDLQNLLMQNVDYLIQYPHGCNEQTASKLRALLLAKQIKEYQGQPFTHEQLIQKGIKRLDKAQNKNGTWGWWKGDKENIWMTVYMVNALHEAKQAGYTSKALNNGLLFLTNRHYV